MGAPVLLALNAVNNLFGVGSSSMMSRALGKKDYQTVSESSAFGFYAALVSGLLFSLICTIFKSPLLQLLGTDAENLTATSDYLTWTICLGAAPSILNVVLAYLVRAEGSTLNASIGTMSGCLLNIVLDPIFILPWGLNMGAAGAGCATFLSNCVACLYFFAFLLIKRGKTVVCINPRMITFSKKIILGICGVGIPAAIQNLLNVTGMTILNNFTSAYGSVAIAAMGIAQKINMVPLYIAMGVGQGIMPLVSYTYAAENYKRMKETVNFSMRVTVAFLLLIAVGYYFGAGVLVRMFMEDVAVVTYGEAFLRAMCLALPFLALDFLAVGVFQACGLGKYALVFAVLRKIVLEIPALIILNWLYPLYGLAYAQFTAELILGITAVIVLSRIFKKLQHQKENSDVKVSEPHTGTQS